jgi:hypothetical protein
LFQKIKKLPSPRGEAHLEFNLFLRKLKTFDQERSQKQQLSAKNNPVSSKISVHEEIMVKNQKFWEKPILNVNPRI